LTVLYPYYDPIQHKGDVSPEIETIPAFVRTIHESQGKYRANKGLV